MGLQGALLTVIIPHFQAISLFWNVGDEKMKGEKSCDLRCKLTKPSPRGVLMRFCLAVLLRTSLETVWHLFRGVLVHTGAGPLSVLSQLKLVKTIIFSKIYWALEHTIWSLCVLPKKLHFWIAQQNGSGWFVTKRATREFLRKRQNRYLLTNSDMKLHGFKDFAVIHKYF